MSISTSTTVTMLTKRAFYPIGLLIMSYPWESFVRGAPISRSVQDVLLSIWMFYFWKEITYMLCDYFHYFLLSQNRSTNGSDMLTFSMFLTTIFEPNNKPSMHSYLDELDALEDIDFATDEESDSSDESEGSDSVISAETSYCPDDTDVDDNEDEDENEDDSEDESYDDEEASVLRCYQGKKLIETYQVPADFTLDQVLKRVDGKRHLPWSVISDNDQETVAIVPPDNWPRDRLRLVLVKPVQPDTNDDSTDNEDSDSELEVPPPPACPPPPPPLPTVSQSTKSFEQLSVIDTENIKRD